MRDKKEMEKDIEELRKKLNLEMQNQMERRVPSEEILELSKKMDKLLNEYHSEHYQPF